MRAFARPWVTMLTRRYYRRLLTNGVRVWEWKGEDHDFVLGALRDVVRIELGVAGVDGERATARHRVPGRNAAD